ncbi:MAG: thiamine pyrophosphate-binding protein [Gammaproteobacteria bacterium]
MPSTDTLLKEETTVPDAIVRVLEEAGIDMVFGIAGGNMGRLYDALYDHQSSVRAVLVRHEQLASVMAEVYGRLTGKPGVATGQGAFILAKALLGTLEAHMGSSPMLLLTDLSDQAPFSHHAPYQGGTGEYGTFDTRKVLEGATKYTTVVQAPTQAVQATQLAIKHALSGEPGPVAVVYHSSAFRGQVGPDSRPVLYPTASYLPRKLRGDPAAIERAARLLVQAERPAIVAGNGVRISQAYAELEAVATALGAPVGTTASGKGVFAETHELALGVCGNFGQATANTWIGEADTVLVVGSRLGPADSANENPALINPARQTLIQIDVEAKNVDGSFPCDEGIVGDAALVLGQLAEAIDAAGAPSADVLAAHRARLEAVREAQGFFSDPGYTSDESPILPQRLFAEIHNGMAADAFITCDAGENRLFMTHYFQTKSAGSLIMPGIGAMGYALPAALAAKLVHPQVIAVTGDGGFGMAMNGLMTALDEDIPVTVVILNNSALGWVKHGQGNRSIASSFTEMNFAEIARAMGCNGIRVEQPNQIAGALAEARASEVITVVDVVTSFGPSFKDVTSKLARG